MPTMRAMQKFSIQNLAMIANALARLYRRDEELLIAVAAELRQRCLDGKPIPANYLPSIVQAFVVRLEFCPSDLVHVIEFSLPLVVSKMEKSDVVLTVPAPPHVIGLCATSSFRNPV